MSVPYADRKPAILTELQKCAKARETITYGRLGAIVGVPGMGPWKPVLDEMSREETEAGRPDITYLVVSQKTGYPGQIDFKPAKPPTDAQKTVADRVFGAIFGHYADPA